ncbi:DNA polymerase III, delta subunit [Calidithermus terrae]|uniref:DNA-directed DNA polymerase n=1 Tax=Calidithermus terrae TaxID=1408545 RepID=A0A399E9Q1_9DEIN|nr:DNA polymerase III subunit delta [Calidithermus terrae]RIH81457.1 DNA polymerase III, delta subunit [Calidithermus terrae]
MIEVFTGDAFLAREALLHEAQLQGLAPRFLPPEPGVVAQEASGGLFGPSGALVDLREVTEGEWKPLREVLEKLPQDALVLLLDPRPTAARSKWYGEHARKRDNPTPAPRELAQWVTNRARLYELKLPAAVANFLGGLIGGKGSYENPAYGLEALDQELRKLTLLDPPLTLEKVQAVVALEPPLSGFDLVRAVTEGKATAAFKHLQNQMERGEDPIRTLGALSWQYSKLARAWAYLQEKPLLGEGEAAGLLGMHPFAAKQTLALAKQASSHAVKAALQTLLEAEQSAKTGGDPRLALERAVSGLLALAAKR